MCMITLLPEREKMSNEIDLTYFENAWEKNKDGCGFAYVEKVGTPEAKVRIFKGLVRFDVFIKNFISKRNENPKSQFMTHFRNATYGEISYANCHPFVVKDMAMTHNGSIYKMNSKKNIGYSDSKELATFISGLPKGWEKNQIYIDLIESYIGLQNKVAFLTPDNHVFYFGGGDSWIEVEDEIIFSNDYFKKAQPLVNSFYKDELCDVCKKEHVFVKINDTKLCENCSIDRAREKTVVVECHMCEKPLKTQGEVEMKTCMECYNKHLKGVEA